MVRTRRALPRRSPTAESTPPTPLPFPELPPSTLLTLCTAAKRAQPPQLQPQLWPVQSFGSVLRDPMLPPASHHGAAARALLSVLLPLLLSALLLAAAAAVCIWRKHATLRRLRSSYQSNAHSEVCLCTSAPVECTCTRSLFWTHWFPVVQHRLSGDGACDPACMVKTVATRPRQPGPGEPIICWDEPTCFAAAPSPPIRLRNTFPARAGTDISSQDRPLWLLCMLLCAACVRECRIDAHGNERALR